MKLAPPLAVLAVLGVTVGCSSKRREPQPEAETAPATAAPAPEAAPAPAPVARAPVVARPADLTVPANFPAECAAYAALIDKLMQCDAIGAGRDGLVSAYRELRAAWPTVPAAQRASVAAQCKSQADSLRNAAAATCSW